MTRIPGRLIDRRGWGVGEKSKRAMRIQKGRKKIKQKNEKSSKENNPKITQKK